MNRRIVPLAVGLVLVLCGGLYAQPFPPFVGGGTAFDPEVDTVNSGVLLDAQVVVSHDRKYVTITTGATRSRLLDLALFPVNVVDGGGFVGGVNPGGGAPGGEAGGTGGAGGGTAAAGRPGGALAQGPPGLNSSPTAIATQHSILNREGMFLLAPLD